MFPDTSVPALALPEHRVLVVALLQLPPDDCEAVLGEFITEGAKLTLADTWPGHLRAIRALAQSGEMAILLVEQYYDFARSLADQYLVMERGEIIMRGRGEDMEKDGVLAALAV